MLETSYGFTGEHNGGYIQLLYLRARMYDAQTGRFLSRDPWEGDPQQPMSYNLWLYGYNNVVNITDPSGKIPTRRGILNGDQVYSCNCGFIDFGHANYITTRAIIEMLDQENSLLSQASAHFRKDAFAISPGSNAIGVGNINTTAVIRSGLSEDRKRAVAHGVYRELMEQVEDAQGAKNLLWYTHYSFEDLTSDEIGFYLGVKFGYDGDPRKSQQAWDWLAEICGFPKDRQAAKDISLQAFQELGGLWSLLFNTPQEKTWLKPLLSCRAGGHCDDGGEWPPDLREFVPATPQRNGEWNQVCST